MASAPKINYFDGSGTTTELTITTNLSGLILTGTIDVNTIDVQINVNGTGYVSNPSLVSVSPPTFTIPNLYSYPDGLELEKGQNTILLRSIDISGSYSSTSTINIEVRPSVDVQTRVSPPTGIRVQRNAVSIELSWSSYSSTDVTGYNVYASTNQGGTGSGYMRVNRDTIPASTPTKTVVEEFPVGTPVSLNLLNPIPGSPGDPNNQQTNLLVVSSRLQPTDTGELDPSVTSQYSSVTTYDMIGVSNFRLNISAANLLTNNFYTFVHNRDSGIDAGILNSETFKVTDRNQPLFYVVTSVYFDKSTGSMVESRYSQEISSGPLPIDTTVRGIRIREQALVVQDYISEVQKSQPSLSLIPGSTVREVHIEPFANEVQKAYFLMDFVHRAKSFEALLQIDDPNRTGTSVQVSSSAYKQSLRSALSLSSDSAVQTLVDGAFTSLAGNFGVPRLGRRTATVYQTFFTTTKPVKDLIVAQGSIVSSSSNSVAPRFRSMGAAIMPLQSIASFYNSVTKRYEVRVQMVADVAGSIGNIPAGSLDTVVSGAIGFQTINEVASDYGRDIQGNLELAENASRTLYSLDTGTIGGYKKTTIGTPGLLDSRIVEAGNTDMMRDYDEIRMKHIGGKVDIYVKGSIERTIVESFAFQYEVAKNIRFDVVDSTTLTLRARDSRLTESNPISEMLYDPDRGYGLRNHSISPTQEYDLTGVTVIDYRTIQVNTILPQPTTMFDDFIEGDYRFVNNNEFIASKQPVVRVVSVVGELSGSLTPDNGFKLYKLDDPLLEGESTRSKDHVAINQINDIPSGESIQINDEKHIIIGQYEESLNSVGINTFSLHVYNEYRTIEYNGPGDSNADYLIVEGTQNTPVKIVRTLLSNIPTGSTVSVDYQHDENFTITYVVNDVLQQLQTRIDAARHATADVLIKQALENPMDIEATVQLQPNQDQATVDQNIRTAHTILTDTKSIGGHIHVSDVIAMIDNTSGVDFVVQPFAKCTLKDGSLRIRDSVNSSGYEYIQSLSKYANAVYILTQSLPFSTMDGGGPDNVHHGVFMDDIIMTMANSLSDVGNGIGMSWIIGKDGAIIDGYSDDATLAPLFITSDDITAERLKRTANKIVVSLNYGIDPPDVPSNHGFSTSYVVYGESGYKDVTTSQIEYLTPGDMTITYKKVSS